MNMLEFCLGGNWVCDWDGPWIFPGKLSIWVLVGRCSGVFGWKFLDRPRPGDMDNLVVGKWYGKGLGHEMGVSSENYSRTSAR